MPAGAVRDRVVVAGAQRADPGTVRAGRRLVLGVLGPLEVEGLRATIRRKPVLWTLVLLAISEGRPVSVDELRDRLASSEDKEPSAPSVRTYVSYLRTALPEGMLPDKGGDAGYLLAGDDVEVDWDTFRALAERARRVDGADRLELAGRALALVRGPVLAHKTWHGVDQAVYHMTVAISDLPAETAAQALRIGRADVAERAGRQGLLGAPGTPKLWQARIDAAKAGSGESVAGIVAQAVADLGPGAEELIDI